MTIVGCGDHNRVAQSTVDQCPIVAELGRRRSLFGEVVGIGGVDRSVSWPAPARARAGHILLSEPAPLRARDISDMFTTHHSRTDHAITDDIVVAIGPMVVIKHRAVRHFCHRFMLGKVHEN